MVRAEVESWYARPRPPRGASRWCYAASFAPLRGAAAPRLPCIVSVAKVWPRRTVAEYRDSHDGRVGSGNRGQFPAPRRFSANDLPDVAPRFESCGTWLLLVCHPKPRGHGIFDAELGMRRRRSTQGAIDPPWRAKPGAPLSVSPQGACS